MERSLGLHRRDAAWPAAGGRRGSWRSVVVPPGRAVAPPLPRTHAAVLHTAALRAPLSLLLNRRIEQRHRRSRTRHRVIVIVIRTHDGAHARRPSPGRVDGIPALRGCARRCDDGGERRANATYRVRRASPAPKDDTTTTTTTTTTAAPAVATVWGQRKKEHDDYDRKRRWRRQCRRGGQRPGESPLFVLCEMKKSESDWRGARGRQGRV